MACIGVATLWGLGDGLILCNIRVRVDGLESVRTQIACYLDGDYWYEQVCWRLVCCDVVEERFALRGVCVLDGE